MNNEILQDLIGQDNIKEALILLMKEFPGGKKGKSIKLLNGRLIELTRRNNEGTISSEAYGLEKNKIRAALLDLIDDESKASGTVSRTNFLPLLIGVFVVLIAVAGIYTFALKGTTAAQKENEEISQQGQTEENEAASEEDQEQIRKNLQMIFGTTPMVVNWRALNFKEDKEYRAGLAYLKRSYTWESDVIVEIPEGGIEVVQADSEQTLQIVVRRARLASSVAIHNKNSESLVNSLWAEETAKDGTFWEGINQLTKTKINDRIKSSASTKKSIAEAVHAAIRKKMEVAGSKDIPIVLRELTLYNGAVVQF